MIRRLRDLLFGRADPEGRREGGRPGDEGPLGDRPVPGSEADLRARYVTGAPSPQKTLDIFDGEWTSSLPGQLANLRAGTVRLFEDTRIDWFIERLGGVRDKAILELGPLEGGHTYMLERAGAASIVSIEANTRAYLRCLITKELLELRSARFLLGDFLDYLRGTKERFDACLACGVLYHMTAPAELISLIARVTDRVCIWTQYYDEALISHTSPLSGRIRGSETAEHEGFEHTLYTAEYEEEALRWEGFCGGGVPYRRLMTRDDILRCLEHFGLGEISIAFDNPDHQHGPAFALTAFRR